MTISKSRPFSKASLSFTVTQDHDSTIRRSVPDASARNSNSKICSPPFPNPIPLN